MSPNLYSSFPEWRDPSLLDMSRLFRNLAKFSRSSRKEERALKVLIRPEAALRVVPTHASGSTNRAEKFLKKHAMVTSEEWAGFIRETKVFVHALFRLLAALKQEGCIDEKALWESRLLAMNQNLPDMFALNKKLSSWAESYRQGEITSELLGAKIKKLCELAQVRLARSSVQLTRPGDKCMVTRENPKGDFSAEPHT